MKHFVFLLYLLSYTTGIGAIALSLNYLKYKPRDFKYLIFTDLCFTLVLIFDTLNFYFRMIVNYYPAGIQIFILLGSFFAAIGMAYFIGTYTCRILNRETNNTFIIVLRSGVILTAGILILLVILTQNRLIPSSTAFHTGFTIVDVFMVGMIGYNFCLLGLNKDKIDQENQHIPIISFIAVLILLPASILANLLIYQVHFRFPLALSPVGYFIVNLGLIIYITRNLLRGMPGEITVPGVVNNKRPLLPSSEIIREYNITERELEVLQLILEGYDNHTIGQKLFISANTVRNHIYNIFRKLGVKSRYELIKFFF